MSDPAPTDNWARLGQHTAPGLVDYLREQLAASHGRLTFDADAIAQRLSLPEQDVRAALIFAVAINILDRVSTITVHTVCGTALSSDDIEAGICPTDEQRIQEGELDTRDVFVLDAPPSRDVPWVLCIHGMNTRGAWQEALAWRVATTYRRSVPVYVYKFGRVELGALVRWRQRQLADRLASTIRTLVGEPLGSRLGPRPDVVCHSLGTWLIGHALLRNEDLRVGRVVLVASILRPDFPWQTLLDRGQVEAVLLHRGGRDLPVQMAAYAIPDSGPSGFLGFDPQVPVTDRLEPSFSHSTFFDPDLLPDSFVNCWQPFLTAPVGHAGLTSLRTSTVPWKAPPWPLRATLLPLVIFLVLLLFGFGVVALMLRGLASIL